MSERSEMHSLLVARSKDQVACDLEGETVLLHLKSGVYYGLNEVATRIWEWIETPRRARDLPRLVIEEYEVDPARCEKDVFKLLDAMAAEGLVEIVDTGAEDLGGASEVIDATPS